MNKLLLITLLTLSFTSIAANNKDNFTLKKAGTAKILVAQNHNPMNYYNCEDECDLEFEYCAEGLPPQSVEVEYCEMDLYSCLDWCNY